MNLVLWLDYADDVAFWATEFSTVKVTQKLKIWHHLFRNITDSKYLLSLTNKTILCTSQYKVHCAFPAQNCCIRCLSISDSQLKDLAEICEIIFLILVQLNVFIIEASATVSLLSSFSPLLSSVDLAALVGGFSVFFNKTMTSLCYSSAVLCFSYLFGLTLPVPFNPLSSLDISQPPSHMDTLIYGHIHILRKARMIFVGQ